MVHWSAQRWRGAGRGRLVVSWRAMMAWEGRACGFKFQTATALNRHCERSEAIHPSVRVVWIASSRSLSSGAHSRDPLAPRNDAKTYLRDLAAHCARVLPVNSRPPIRGRRECRTLGASAAACAVVESTRVSHHGHAGNVRHSPRNGFNGFLRALPGDRACLPPSLLRSLLLRSLMPASGHQDHTTSPSASSAIRQRRHPRPPHPVPRS
jgi:hypothetical protein